MFEIVITLIILCTAIAVLYKNIKKKKLGACNCGNCTSHCSNYNNPVIKKK